MYEGCKIGNWLTEQKKKIIDKNSETYKKLSQNKYVKRSLDNNLLSKAKKKIE